LPAVLHSVFLSLNSLLMQVEFASSFISLLLNWKSVQLKFTARMWNRTHSPSKTALTNERNHADFSSLTNKFRGQFRVFYDSCNFFDVIEPFRRIETIYNVVKEYIK